MGWKNSGTQLELEYLSSCMCRKDGSRVCNQDSTKIISSQSGPWSSLEACTLLEQHLSSFDLINEFRESLLFGQKFREPHVQNRATGRGGETSSRDIEKQTARSQGGP